MGSNGGVFEAPRASPCRRWRWNPVRQPASSRPRWWRARPARPNLLSFDMGGTTAKASLIRDGEYETTPDYEVGGGSSVDALDERHRPSDPRAGDRSRRSLRRRRLDRLGRPRRCAARRPEERRRRSRARSATARGGTEPTVTDCNLLLGYLDKGSLLGGRSADRSRRRRGRRRASGSPSRSASMCARPLPPSSTSSITPWRRCSRSSRSSAATIRAISSLAAFGGAGPLHAAALAERARHRRGHLPADSGRVLGARPGRHGSASATTCARVYTHDGDRRSRQRLEAAFAALEERGRSHARPRRRRAERAALRAFRRCALCSPILRAAVPVPARAVDAAALGGDRRGLP